MIKPGEIQQIANGLGIRDTQIEKDYIIGWVLKGIFRNEYLKDCLVFKGGTALRKIYFHNYRYLVFVAPSFMTEKINLL